MIANNVTKGNDEIYARVLYFIHNDNDFLIMILKSPNSMPQSAFPNKDRNQ